MEEPAFTQALLNAVSKVYAMDYTAVDALAAIPVADLTDVQVYAVNNAEQAMTDRAVEDMAFFVFVSEHLDGLQEVLDTDYILSFAYLNTAHPGTAEEKIAEVKTWNGKRFKTLAKSLSIYSVAGNVAIAAKDGVAIEEFLGIINEINSTNNAPAA